MLKLPDSVRTWGTPGFDAALKAELTALAARLPLDCAATPGSHVEIGTVAISVLACAGQADTLRVAVGVFFNETVASCGCGDEPYAQPAYCELQLDIDRATGMARARLADE